MHSLYSLSFVHLSISGKYVKRTEQRHYGKGSWFPLCLDRASTILLTWLLQLSQINEKNKLLTELKHKRELANNSAIGYTKNTKVPHRYVDPQFPHVFNIWSEMYNIWSYIQFPLIFNWPTIPPSDTQHKKYQGFAQRCRSTEHSIVHTISIYIYMYV